MKKAVIYIITIMFVISMGLLSIGCKEEAAKEEMVEEEVVTEEAAEEEMVEEEVVTEEAVGGKVKPIKITLWVNVHIRDYMEDFFYGFNDVQDEYILDLIKVPEPLETNIFMKWSAGQKPDILNINATQVNFNMLDAVNNFIDLSDMNFVQTQKYGLTEFASVEGKVFAPQLFPPAIFGVIVNKKVWESVGLTSWNYPNNFTEFKELIKTFQGKGIEHPIWGPGGELWTLKYPLILLSGSFLKDNPDFIDNVNTGKDDFCNPEWIAMLQDTLDLYNMGAFNEDYLIAKMAELPEGLMGTTGKAAMYLGANNQIQNLVVTYGLEQVDETLDFFPLSKDYPAMTINPGTGPCAFFVVDNGDADKIRGSKMFIDFITGTAPYEQYYQKYLLDSKTDPMFEGFETPEIPKVNQKMLDTLDELGAKVMYGTVILASFGNEGILLQEMLYGTKTPEEVAEVATEEFRKNAKEAGLPGF